MDILRTPDSRFERLPDFDFKPHYTTIHSDDGTAIRIHHIEAGPRDGPLIVLMHGNPTWSFIHRHMMKGLAAAGCRAVAVDLVGLGRSDKPALKSDYTLDRHVDWMTQWFRNNDLSDVTLFCQDWGGHIGLIVVAENPGWFNRIIAANTGLPEGRGASEFLLGWIAMMEDAERFPWDFFKGGMTGGLSEDAFRAYLAPFPDDSFMAGIVKFPSLICEAPDNPGVPRCTAAWERLEAFEKPVLTLFGDSDPVTAGGEKILQQRIPGAAGQAHQLIAGAGHFIQEEAGEQLVPHILRFMGIAAATPNTGGP